MQERSYRRSGNVILFTGHAFFPQECLWPQWEYYYRRVPGNTKKGLYWKVPPTFLRTAEWKQQLFREQHPGRSWRCATRTTERLNRSVVSSWKIKTNKKAQKSETKRRYIRIEKGGYYVSDHFYLQPKWWIPEKVKITQKQRKTEQTQVRFT